jgi:hypothetical protein
MSRTEILEKEILNGIKMIESFSENDRLKVHKIYTDIYKKYLSLSKEDFINDFFYNQHISFIVGSSERHKNEIKNLLDEKYLVDVEDNFFQIKMSLRGMIPHKIIS